ncbi:hypothetical protein DAERI_110181 [Deinococcus aerius]|uniref:Uncharacterized protein n=1 Tax=Deinococcus aerius TaxID=200253 RepID=A0A2I9CY04_9DEIO|nr:hypothetical protein DAERI_110181 [Deinococcus aerius]
MDSDYSYIQSIQKKIENGELKPSFTVSDTGICGQDIISNNGRYSCLGYNILDGIYAGQVGGHVYLSCNVIMSYMKMTGNIYTTDYKVVGRTASGERTSLNPGKQLLVTLDTVPYTPGKTYCVTSIGEVVFPGETTLKTQASRLPDCKAL